MVPFAPTTAPSVTPPARVRRQRILPVVGPAVVAEPLCRASCSSDGQGAHVAVPGTAPGTSSALTGSAVVVAPPHAASKSRLASPDTTDGPTVRAECLKLIPST